VDSSSVYCTLELGLVKEYNTYIWFGTWDINTCLSNHVKNKLAYSIPLSFYFNYIVGYRVNLK
jgi:hypothetical protein